MTLQRAIQAGGGQQAFARGFIIAAQAALTATREA
jgi:hypothetical protein